MDVSKRSVKAIDYKTLLLLTGLFIVIEGLSHAGVITEIAKLFVSVGGHSKLFMHVLIVGASVLISAFVDNIPTSPPCCPWSRTSPRRWA